MSSISIIGAGTMARILGTRALAGGNTVEVIGRDAAKAAALPGNSAAPQQERPAAPRPATSSPGSG
jgi:3-hydroxyisobutyrate dehydrogenase-like beta-hydroxyacid dehydrogenase